MISRDERVVMKVAFMITSLSTGLMVEWTSLKIEK